MALGADGWMADFGEWLPTDAALVGGSGQALHNRYPVLWQQLHREVIDRMPDQATAQRLFFVRSGWFGSPPLADAFWAGDQRTDFEKDDGMPTVLPMAIGLGAVGISTYGSDIGGYNSVNNPNGTKELFFRWSELGAWSPVMRTHHGNYAGKNWAWDSDAETILHFRRYASLHMALVPYFEGLARVASSTGVPILRGLFLEYPSDASTWPLSDELLVGEGILVAPVMEASATSRSVYFPQGRWYPWGGGTAVTGPTTSRVSAPLGEIPVYAAAGAIVPMYPDGVMTVVNGSPGVRDAASVKDDRTVRAFLGASGAFTEAGGQSYVLAHVVDGPPGCAGSLAWNGAPIAAGAPVAGGLPVSVTGPGSLEVRCGGSLTDRVEVTGGAADRRLTIVVTR
jgi:alpha-glucosidase (family GH31 glycosyl hydrolase)